LRLRLCAAAAAPHVARAGAAALRSGGQPVSRRHRLVPHVSPLVLYQRTRGRLTLFFVRPIGICCIWRRATSTTSSRASAASRASPPRCWWRCGRRPPTTPSPQSCCRPWRPWACATATSAAHSWPVQPSWRCFPAPCTTTSACIPSCYQAPISGGSISASSSPSQWRAARAATRRLAMLCRARRCGVTREKSSHLRVSSQRRCSRPSRGCQRRCTPAAARLRPGRRARLRRRAAALPLQCRRRGSAARHAAPRRRRHRAAAQRAMRHGSASWRRGACGSWRRACHRLAPRRRARTEPQSWLLLRLLLHPRPRRSPPQRSPQTRRSEHAAWIDTQTRRHNHPLMILPLKRLMPLPRLARLRPVVPW
jgi:hypothetical protein